MPRDGFNGRWNAGYKEFHFPIKCVVIGQRCHVKYLEIGSIADNAREEFAFSIPNVGPVICLECDTKHSYTRGGALRGRAANERVLKSSKCLSRFNDDRLVEEWDGDAAEVARDCGYV